MCVCVHLCEVGEPNPHSHTTPAPFDCFWVCVQGFEWGKAYSAARVYLLTLKRMRTEEQNVLTHLGFTDAHLAQLQRLQSTIDKSLILYKKMHVCCAHLFFCVCVCR